MTGQLTDQVLLQQYAIHRDAQAFADLVRQYQRLVFATCRRVLHSPADVDDAVQETFLRLARKAGDIRTNPGAWLHRCAVNVSTDLNRRRETRRRHEAVAARPVDASGDKQFDAAELREHVDSALAKLEEEQRELIIQRFFVGRPQGELAKTFGVTASAMTYRVDKAVEALREQLQAMGCVAGAGLITAMMDNEALATVPQSLTENVMKIGLKGIGADKTTGALGSKVMAATAAGILVALLAGTWWWFGSGRRAAGTPPAPATALRATGKDNSMTRFLLEGDTLRVGFYGVGKAPYPEDVVPAGVLRALSQQLKTELQTQGIFWGDYCYFAGISGEAFRFIEFMNLTGPETGKAVVERYGNMTAAEMYRTSLQAAGYECQIHLKADLPDQASLRQQIVQSLRDRQTPVIGLGIFGPRPESFLITGYDEAGDVLLGWSHLQDNKKGDPNISFEPTGQFRLRNWYGAIDGVIIVTGKAQKPTVRDIYRNAIERAIRELRTTRGNGGDRALGTAAIEKWAVHLETDANFTGLAADELHKRQSDHGSTAGEHAERRALAASFIELAIRALPEAKEDLTLAQAAFQGSHDTVYEIWETVAGNGPFDPDFGKFADPAHRHTIAMLVRRLADLDRRGVACLERALKIVDGKEPGEPIPANAVLDGDAALEKAKASPGEPSTRAPENIPIANSLSMLQTFLGEEIGQLNEAEKSHHKLSYVLWMGYSGAAFGMSADGPERANLPLVFDALGYDYELWMSGELARETGLPARDWGWDDNLRRRIFWNLRDRRLPVLLFGCGKWPDWWLVTQVRHWGLWGEQRGYGGNSGEDYRPGEPLNDPKNPLREIHLMDTMKGKQTWTINLTGKRPGNKPSMEELYRRAIEWGAKQIRGPRMKLIDNQGREYISTNPCKDWAQMMTTESLFPAGDPVTLKARRSFLESAEVDLAERRNYGAAFLDMAAIRLDRPELKQAAEHFRNVNRLIEEVWAQTGGLHAPDGHMKYADRNVRERIVDFLLEIGREEEEAAVILSRGSK